jgi:hypothetical protein
MKYIPGLIFSATLLFACSTGGDLTPNQASRIIVQEKQYPKIIDYDIYCSDPIFVEKAINAGLEEKGLVRIHRTQKMGEIGKPLIEFTEKAKQYLLPTSEQDKKANIQKVKIAEEDLLEVTGITRVDDPRQLYAEYTTTYKNLNAFASLTKVSERQKSTHKAHFVRKSDNWELND